MRTTTIALMLTATITAAEPPKGYTPLFNGKDLTGWKAFGSGGDPRVLEKLDDAGKAKKQAEWDEDAKKHWSVQNEELVNDGQGAYVGTAKDYGDFELLIDYKTVPKADSGIYLRGTPQVQIWDTTEEAKFKLGADKGSGALWNNPAGAAGKDPLVKADKPFGEWNSFRILMVGERVSIWLNGKHVVDHARLYPYWDKKKPLPKTGPILLQTHGGEIRWRNIAIREIGTDEANKILAEKANVGMKAIFNGKDFNGWQGTVDNYEVVDGAIVCKPKKGGALFTKDLFQDFTVTMEIKLPAGGNNGLGIRYPGKGDGAYTGMTELQVLDDSAEKYKKLDPRQYHGSAYGMVASQRGYQRPVGEWNFQRVTVKGPKIEVELNGTLILDADLSTVKEFMANTPHPGKDIENGHFALLGHGDAVAFRNVMAMTLNK